MASNKHDFDKTESDMSTKETSPNGIDVDVGESIDPTKERRLLAKLDVAFVPIIMLVYLTCFLDRSNIGNVKIAGMPQDIGATPEQFNIAVSIFYATYVTFETPWAVMLKRIGPKYLLSGLCVVWSLTTVCSGFISNPGGLYTVRLVLGLCEAGLFPSLNLYLTMVYRREEMAKRVSYLFVCAAISGAFGGLLAYAILQMNGVAGYAGWRWVYIIEGIASFLIAPLIFFGLPNDPSTAYFLNAEDRQLMKIRAAQRVAYMGSDEFDWREIKIAFQDPKLYLSGCIQFCQDILLYGFSTFLPSIIESLGFPPLEVQYLTIPVYLCGGACFLLISFFSDRLCIRGPFVAFANLFGILGYILIIVSETSDGVKFFGTFMCAIAVYTGPGLNLTWLNVNVAPHYRRATAIGFQQTMGNTAGIVAGQIYRESPYLLGNSFSLGALCVSQMFIAGKWWYIRKKNAQKKKILDGAIEDRRRIRTGDADLNFRYHP